MVYSLIQLLVTFLVILGISRAGYYYLLTRKIVTRLRVGQAPKSEFGIVRVDGFSSHAHARSGGTEYEPDPPFDRVSADVLR